MSTSNCIKSLLGIEDKNIIFEENCYLKKKVNYQDTHIIHAKLTYEPCCCEVCGASNDGANIVKNGFKATSIRLNTVSNLPAILKLKKQRFVCRECGHSFIATTNIVNKFSSISNSVKNKISLDLANASSIKDIASFNFVSSNTVIRVLRDSLSFFMPDFSHLDKVLCFDEFKSF